MKFGDHVLVDGTRVARVVAAFPEGSTSLLTPHVVITYESMHFGERHKVDFSRVKPHEVNFRNPPRVRRGMEDDICNELYIEQTSDGDPRRCPRHPEVTTSSTDGLFDAPCHLCEASIEEALEEQDELDDARERAHLRWLQTSDDEERFDGPANDMKGNG